MIEIPIYTGSRWRVVFKTKGWQCGIYRPEFTSVEDITYLERHNRPEVFVPVKGNIVLVLSEDGNMLREIPLRKNNLYVITEWHNAYRPDGKEGIALVIEHPAIKTEYLSLENFIKNTF